MYFLQRARTDRRYREHFRERLGRLEFSSEPTAAAAIWLHAVSVGEVISAVSLVAALRQACPNTPVFVSCSTIAGRAIAQQKLSPLVQEVFYAPLDYVFFIRRVLQKLRPTLVIVMETEIWPNLYREVKQSGPALAIINGRISDRTFPRYRRWAWAFRAVLEQPDLILVQSEQDRQRYAAVGAPPERTEAAGNLKYDFAPSQDGIPAEIREFLAALNPGQICIAASTMPPRDSDDADEDDVVIAAFPALAERHRDLLLILVPRSPERFSSAAAKLEAAGVPYQLRSALPKTTPPELPCVLVLDSMGELSRLFAIADVVFMGGTLARRGGHNILEPAYFGKAVIAGPHMENFSAIAEEFTAAKALVRISEAGELAQAITRLLESPQERNEVGQRARNLALSKRGVTHRVTQQLLNLYGDTVPSQRASLLLAPLAWLWEYGVRFRRKRALQQICKLDQPVISIGGITMGGSGKTPFTAWLAAECRSQGLQPAILTRGYRRRSTESCILLPAGSRASADLTGDESQMYVRQGLAHVAIGADRFECGRKLSEVLKGPDVFLLDDGFQHWRLHRDVDIVLIDALNPFGGGRIFPEGRLREPLSGLKRASAFIITRVEPGISTQPIEHELRRWNRDAPIFRSSVVPHKWVDSATLRSFSTAPFKLAGAFCGLANPATFWRTLDALGVKTSFRWAFSDHHRYTIRELKRLGRHAREQHAEALIVTEKDVANFCKGATELLAPIPVYALQIGIEVEDGQRLLDLIGKAR